MSIIYSQRVTVVLKYTVWNTSNKEKMWIPAAVSAGEQSFDYTNKPHVKTRPLSTLWACSCRWSSWRRDLPPCSSCSWGCARPSAPGGERGCRLRHSDPSHQTSCGTGNPSDYTLAYMHIWMLCWLQIQSMIPHDMLQDIINSVTHVLSWGNRKQALNLDWAGVGSFPLYFFYLKCFSRSHVYPTWSNNIK